ncbi:tripartite tricarboxylate transporter substrate binding protein [Roseomonas gilardii]|uniref:Bug family tripartite tricarboxylate transporter substrate binding protein n=1 Tax=Roseomonas gilardii TaxID=257708 RepID=UPI0021B6AFB3|nr:tripartite tricarboxylate transporter substrate binding protein [Roseomonas gilardii]
MLGRRGLGLGVLGAASLAAGGARAASWPDHPLRWVVGYPPGGASDVFARLIGAGMGTALGQNVVVENRPGGGAVLASELVSHAAPDGYTWLHTDNGNLVYNPALYAKLPYDPDRDLTGVGFIGRFPLFLVVRPDDPARSFADFLAAAPKDPPTYGTAGVASPHHLAMEMLRRRVGNFPAVHVPYRGAPAAMQDLIAGTVDCVVVDCATGIPFLRDGKARALLVMSEARSQAAPEVPTALELGYADAVAYGWQGLSVPAATPPDLVAKLNATLNATMRSDLVQARLSALGIETSALSPAEFNAFVAKESGRWRPLIKELGIRLDS